MFFFLSATAYNCLYPIVFKGYQTQTTTVEAMCGLNLLGTLVDCSVHLKTVPVPFLKSQPDNTKIELFSYGFFLYLRKPSGRYNKTL